MLRTLQSWYNRHKVLFWIITGLLACYTAAGFVVTPMVVHHLINTTVAQKLDRQVTVGSVSANPYTFSMRLSDLAVADRDGAAFVNAKEISVNAQPLASLFKWGLVVKSVIIMEPHIRVLRTHTHRFNFSDLLEPKPDTDPPKAAGQEPPPRFVLSLFRLEQGRIGFIDQAADAPFQSTLSAVTIALDQLDTRMQAGSAQIRISARSEAAETIEVTGRIDVAPLDVVAGFSVKNLQMAKYAPYYGPLINARIDNGTVGVEGKVRWSMEEQIVDVLQGRIQQVSAAPAHSDRPALVVPEFSIEDATIDIRRQMIQLGRVTSRNGEIIAARNQAGEINLLTAFGPPSAGQPPAAEKTPAAAHDWVVTLPELNIAGYTVRFTDERVTPPAQLSLTHINAAARDLSTRKDQLGTTSLDLNWVDQGKITVKGTMGLTPLQAALDVTMKDLDIRPLQPYINDHVWLVVTEGSMDTTGRLRIAPHDTNLDIQYRGQAAFNNFKSVDTKQSNDFLKWESLFFDGLELDTAPFRLHIDEVALTDFYERLIIFEDGTTNVLGLLTGKYSEDTGQGGAEEPAPSGPDDPGDTAAPDIQIRTVTLQEGTIDFSDRHIQPNAHLPMTAVGGRISGLDAIKTHRADVLLRGMVNENVPMQIKGQINPLIAIPYVDLKLDFAGIDLSPFTPYSGKYLGYTLDKGQLSLNLSYLVADNKLSGQNKILLNQLTLGKTIPSEKATKLPIKLAIALLKDRHGNIDLDLPVSGDLDDPEFSIGGIVLKMVVNLIVNIVTSPFKMLGALFGGGEELAYLDFEPGSGALPSEGTAKLDSLAKILFERPGLNLEIQGHVDPEKDREGLRRIRFEQALKSAKLNAMLSSGQKAIPLEQIVLTPEERDGLILEAYTVAEFPKPRDDKGQLKALSPAEMQKLLYTDIALSADDMRLLANQRASAAKTYLLQTAQVAIDRLFVIEPKIEAGSPEETLQSRVQFNLK